MTHDGRTCVKLSLLQPPMDVGITIFGIPPIAMWYCAFAINENTVHIENAVPERSPFFEIVLFFWFKEMNIQN